MPGSLAFREKLAISIACLNPRSDHITVIIFIYICTPVTQPYTAIRHTVMDSHLPSVCQIRSCSPPGVTGMVTGPVIRHRTYALYGRRWPALHIQHFYLAEHSSFSYNISGMSFNCNFSVKLALPPCRIIVYHCTIIHNSSLELFYAHTHCFSPHITFACRSLCNFTFSISYLPGFEKYWGMLRVLKCNLRLVLLTEDSMSNSDP